MPRNLFRKILSLIDDLRPRPAPALVGDIDGTSKRQARCVYMTRKLTESPSKRRPISKIRPSDDCGENSVRSTMVRGYDFHKPKGYLRNVG